MIEYIETDIAPKAVGPYSQAILVNGNTLYISGQVGINPETGELIDSEIEAQTEQVVKNISAILTEANFTFDNIVKTDCYLAYMGDFKKFNHIYEKYFTSKPARTCVSVSDMPKGALLEIAVIAVK